jgi:hypothetical protein
VIGELGLSEGIEGTLEVRDCPHGRGVFALRDFDEGETVAMVVGGEFVKQPKSTNGYALRIEDNQFWDEIPAGDPAFWSNFLDHDNLANCRFVDFELDLPGARLIAVGRIEKGDELCLNYREYHKSNPVF